jgi:hypothetical protein
MHQAQLTRIMALGSSCSCCHSSMCCAASGLELLESPATMLEQHLQHMLMHCNSWHDERRLEGPSSAAQWARFEPTERFNCKV